MSAQAISSDLRTYAVKRWPTANHKFRKSRLADLLGMTERRVRSFWEATAAAPRDEEIIAIKTLVGGDQTLEEVNKYDFEALQERIARLEAIINSLEAQPDHKAMADRGEGNYGRRRTDVPRASLPDETADQSHWGR